MKTVILGTNNNPDYINYYPYITMAWNSLGWKTLTFHISDDHKLEHLSDKNNRIVLIAPQKIYNDVLLSQVYRIMAHNYISNKNEMIMTSDIDMMPLSDYWRPQNNKITCYGYDLTHRVHYPICYIAANKQLWHKLVPEQTIEELLDKYDCAKSNNFNEYWYTDQHIITQRIKQSKDDVIEVDRNFNKYGLAYGRIDRSAWQHTWRLQEAKIDAHMPRPFNAKEAKILIMNHFNMII